MKRTGPRHGDRTSGSSEIVAIEKRVAVTERMDQPSASSGKPTPVVIQPQLRLGDRVWVAAARVATGFVYGLATIGRPLTALAS
jgi:hypothetical protein